jgi:hypothetical protein
LTVKGLGMIRRSGLWICLLMILLLSSPVWGMQPNVEKDDLLTGLKDYYTEEEVTEIVLEILRIAEEEIERTAISAGKEAAAQSAGEAEYYRQLSEMWFKKTDDLESENKVIAKENRWLKFGLFTTGGISIGAIVFSLLCGLGK